MKRRLWCMTLVIIMMLSVVLTGCSNNDDESNVNKNEGAETITLWVITDKDVSKLEGAEKEAALKAMDDVEEAFSRITKSKYKVNVDIQFYTEEEYYDALENAIDTSVKEREMAEEAQRALRKAIRDAKNEGNTDEAAVTRQFYIDHPEYAKYQNWNDDDDEENTGVVEDETIINDYGIPELKYPDTEENQVDVIYLSGYKRYTDYIEREWLYALNEELSGSSKKINNYISSSLLNGVKIDGTTYAIPNNVSIGEYTYMMLDKELFDKYYYSYDEITDILDCKDFLADIKKLEPDVVPIDATFDECMELFVWYWTLSVEEIESDDVDENGRPVKSYSYSYATDNKFNICGTVYKDAEHRGRGNVALDFNSLFTLPEYREIFLQLMEYKYNGYYGEANDGERAAISFKTGDYSIKSGAAQNKGVYTDENGKEYYAVVVKYPEADEYSLYGNMFGVYALSNHVSASMEIITALNTNSELRNILQYGIEGVHYEINETTGVLNRIKNSSGSCDYLMDIEKTGNCFIAHPEEGLSPDYWDMAKSQNDEALINPLLGFSYDDILGESDAKLDNTLIEYINLLASNTLESIEACTTYDELYALVNTTTTGLIDTLKPAKNPQIYIPGFKDPVTVNLAKYCNNSYDTATGAGGEEDKLGESPCTVYFNWLRESEYLPE